MIDYQALINTNVQALPFLNQLASDISVGGSYQQLATASVTVGQLLNALAETVNTSGTGNTGGALLALQSLQLQLGTGTAMPLSSLIDLTPLNGRTIGGVIPDTNPSLQLNLMSLLSAKRAHGFGGTAGQSGHVLDHSRHQFGHHDQAGGGKSGRPAVDGHAGQHHKHGADPSGHRRNIGQYQSGCRHGHGPSAGSSWRRLPRARPP